MRPLPLSTKCRAAWVGVGSLSRHPFATTHITKGATVTDRFDKSLSRIIVLARCKTRGRPREVRLTLNLQASEARYPFRHLDDFAQFGTLAYLIRCDSLPKGKLRYSSRLAWVTALWIQGRDYIHEHSLGMVELRGRGEMELMTCEAVD